MPVIRLPYSLIILAYCALIFWVSHQPQPVDVEGVPGLDKVAHMFEYGLLALLVSVGLRRSNATVHPIMQFLGPVAFAFTYGLFDELHQYFVPERSFDPLDLIADLFGALAAQWVLCKLVWGIPVGRQAGD